MSRSFLTIVVLVGLTALVCAAAGDGGFVKWPLPKAVKMLTDSPWARVETFARVIGGTGSGASGEKEIYYSFYVRLLSARPVREAYTRIQLIQHGYDEMAAEDADRLFSDLIENRVAVDFEKWIVVALSFRCNDPNEESRLRQFFQSQTTGTLKNKAFLVTSQFSQLPLTAYFAPREEGVGARFVFPRQVDGVAVATVEDANLTFELTDLPAITGDSGGERQGQGRGRGRGRGRGGGRGGNNRDEDENAEKGILRATFSVRDMIVDGELVL